MRYLSIASWLAGTLVTAELILRVRDRRRWRRFGPPKPNHILVLGDSIARGYHLPLTQTWPARLLCRLRSAHPDRNWHLFNAAAPGATILQGLSRLQRDVLPFRPALLLVAFGLNDGHLQRTHADDVREKRFQATGRVHLWAAVRRLVYTLEWQIAELPLVLQAGALPRVSPKVFTCALNLLVQRAQLAGCQIALLTPTRVDQRFHPEWTAKRQQQQKQIYATIAEAVRQVAHKRGVLLIDVATMPCQCLLGEDGIHLSAAGQEHVAEFVYDQLRCQWTGLE